MQWRDVTVHSRVKVKIGRHVNLSGRIGTVVEVLPQKERHPVFVDFHDKDFPIPVRFAARELDPVETQS